MLHVTASDPTQRDKLGAGNQRQAVPACHAGERSDRSTTINPVAAPARGELLCYLHGVGLGKRLFAHCMKMTCHETICTAAI